MKVAVGESNILIMHQEEILISTSGYTGKVDTAIASLLMEDDLYQSYIAGVNLYPYLARINQAMCKLPGWKMRISGKRRQKVVDDKLFIAGSFFVDYISYDRKIERSMKRDARRRIDILNLEMILDHPPVNSMDQFNMAVALIDLQHSRGIRRIKTSRGAIGAGLLRKSPYWEKNRHAAPKFLNDFARKHLPGNYYALSPKAEKRRFHTFEHCYYIDQYSSHHNICSTTPIPHPHHLRGRGFYREAITEKPYYPIWCRIDSDIGKSIASGQTIGLFLARISYTTPPPRNEYHLYPPWAKEKRTYVWLWSPDIRFILANKRIKLDSFVAGFCADTSDPALVEYSEWALNYLRENPRDKTYTKSTLLAAYGMLGFNNESNRRIYKYWGGTRRGIKVVLPEAGTVTEKEIVFKEGIQHSLVNVIARGMIEAETRTRTFAFAQNLHNWGYEVVQVYADGIMVYTDALPIIPVGWRVTDSLTNVYIPRPNAFISDQVTKMPGTPLSEDEVIWQDIREKSRKPLTARQ